MLVNTTSSTTIDGNTTIDKIGKQSTMLTKN